MASRKGTLLERNVEQLLKLVGLKPELNKIYHGYEIDVFLRHNNHIIAFECKQYEKSSLTVRNLIHQWDSKNKELNLDKIVLVFFGIELNNTDKELAKKYDITVWDEHKLKNLLSKAIDKKEEFLEKLFSEIGIDTSNENLLLGAIPDLKVGALRPSLRNADFRTQKFSP